MLLVQNARVLGDILDVLCINNSIVKIGKIDYKLLRKIFSAKDINVIDATGKVIIPSYIDNHVHIIGGGGENGFSSRISEMKVDDIIKYGVTTVVGVLGTDTVTKSVENLVAKTKSLNEEGITAYCLTGGYEYPPPTLTGQIQKDIVFINEIIGLKTAISDHRCYNPNYDNLVKIISEARTAGLISNKAGIINIHVGYGKGNMDVLLDIIENTNIPIKNIFPTHVTKTDVIMEQAVKMMNMGGYVDVTVNKSVQEIAEKLVYMVKHGNESLITVSSDANGSCPIWDNGIYKGMSISNMEGLHNLVKELILKYNYTLDNAISFVTSNPANLLKLNRKGKIIEKNDADMLLIDKDLEITEVIAKGKVLLKKR